MKRLTSKPRQIQGTAVFVFVLGTLFHIHLIPKQCSTWRHVFRLRLRAEPAKLEQVGQQEYLEKLQHQIADMLLEECRANLKLCLSALRTLLSMGELNPQATASVLAVSPISDKQMQCLSALATPKSSPKQNLHVRLCEYEVPTMTIFHR